MHPLPPDPRAPVIAAALRRAGDEALARVRSAAATLKADGTWVTDADVAAEAALVEALGAAFPDDGVVSEEGTAREGRSGAVWYVDPIDGTHPFLEGLAHWGPTVCRVADGQLDVGAFYLPRTGELWFASAGGGAWRDGVRLRPPELEGVGRNDVLFLPSHAHRVGPIHWPGRSRALGCTAAHLALVASGGAAAAVVPTWRLWDIGCGALLLHEAGRALYALSGARFDPMMADGQPFFAAAAGVVPTVTAAFRALGPQSGS